MTKPSDRQPDERLADWVDERMTARERDRFEGEMRVNKELRQQAEAYRRTVEQIRGALQAPMPKLDIADEVLQRLQHPVAAPVRVRRTLRRGPLLASGLAAAALLITAVLIQGLPTKDEPSLKKTADARGLVDPSPSQDQPEAMLRRLDAGALADNEREKFGEELQKRGEPTAHDDFVVGGQKPGEQKPGDLKAEDKKLGETAKTPGAAKQDGDAARQEAAAAAGEQDRASGKKELVRELGVPPQAPPASTGAVRQAGRKDAAGKETGGKDTDKDGGNLNLLERSEVERRQAAPAPLQQLAVVPTVQTWVLTRQLPAVEGAEKAKGDAGRPAAAPVAATPEWKNKTQAGQTFYSFLAAVPGPAGGEPATVTQLQFDFGEADLAGISDEATRNARRATYRSGLEALGLHYRADSLDNGSINLRDNLAAGADGNTTALYLVEGTQAQVAEVLRVVSGWALTATAEKRLEEIPATAVDSLRDLNEQRKNAGVAGNQATGGGGAATQHFGRAQERSRDDGKKGGEEKLDANKDVTTLGSADAKSRGGVPKPPAAPPVDRVRVLIVLRDEVPPPPTYKKK